MFKSALAILKIVKDQLMSRDSLEDINDVFDDTTKHLNDHSTLIYYLILRRFEFDYDFLIKSRLNLQGPIIESITKNNENKVQNPIGSPVRRRASYVNKEMECFRDWPLCIYDLGYKYNVISYLWFRVHNPPNVIEDYFFDKTNRSKKRKYTQSKKAMNMKIPRKKSKSSDIRKVKFEDINNNKHKDKPKSTDHSPKNSDVNYGLQLSIYKNLLMERRPHHCVESDEKKEVEVPFQQYNNEDTMSFGFDEMEVEENFIEIKNNSNKMKGTKDY